MGPVPVPDHRHEAISKTDRVYEHVLSQHTRGEYGAGQRLIIAQIAEETGVSAVPVREALSRLTADGIVEYQHQRGFRIRRLDPAHVAAALEAHAIIEAAAIGLAARRIDADALAELHRRSDALSATISEFDAVGFVRASDRFHQLLLHYCPNPVLLELLTRGTLHTTALQAASAVLAPKRAAAVVAEHNQLLARIEEGADPAVIEKLARTHRLRTAESYQRSVATRAGHRTPRDAAVPSRRDGTV